VGLRKQYSNKSIQACKFAGKFNEQWILVYYTAWENYTQPLYIYTYNVEYDIIL